MALALYRKYRPRTFAEVIGQEHVTEPLSQALRSGRLHHAYLFSGPRGCGKTSSARILARSLNCEQGPTPEPCGVCISCRSLANDGTGSIDVLEIDAASHGGVEDARELREKAFFAPANSRFKIYVIDEAHMVSSAGFNALLKLVEEPPDYVKFIFATTEPDKVLGTIRSRTHHYPFRLIPPATLRPYLQQLTEAEGVSVEPAVFPLVVRAGGGSARDSLSVLDQLIAGAGPDGVSYARAVALLGVTDVALIDEMCDALAAGDGATAYSTIDRVAEAGHDPRRFASDLLERFRDLIVLQQVPDAVAKGLIDGPTDQLEAMSAQATRLGPATLSRCADIVHNGLIEMRGTTAPRLLLELITARMLLPGAEDSTGSLLQRLERMERRLTLSGDTPTGVRGEHPAEQPTTSPAPVSGAPASDDSGGGGLSAARAAAAAARRASGATAVARPAADPTLGVAGPTSGVVGSTPAVAGATPAVAGPIPAVAGATPAVAGPTPGVVGSTPAVAGPTPGVVGSTSAVAGPVAASNNEPDWNQVAAGVEPVSSPAARVEQLSPGHPSDHLAEPPDDDEPPWDDEPESDQYGPPAEQSPAVIPRVAAAAVPQPAAAPSAVSQPVAAPSVAAPSVAAPSVAAPSVAAPSMAELPQVAEADPRAAADFAGAVQPAEPTAPARRTVPAGVLPDAPEEPGEAAVAAAIPGQLDVTAVREVWPEIITAIGRHSKKIAALASGATVRDFDGQTVVLTFRFPAHARMVAPEATLITDALYEALGGRWNVRCDVAGAGESTVPSSGRASAAGREPAAGSMVGGRESAAGSPAGGREVAAGSVAGGQEPVAGSPTGGREVAVDSPVGGREAAADPAAGERRPARNDAARQDLARNEPPRGADSRPAQPEAGAVQATRSAARAPQSRRPEAETPNHAGGDDDWPEPAKPGGVAATVSVPPSDVSDDDEDWPEVRVVGLGNMAVDADRTDQGAGGANGDNGAGGADRKSRDASGEDFGAGKAADAGNRIDVDGAASASSIGAGSASLPSAGSAGSAGAGSAGLTGAGTAGLTGAGSASSAGAGSASSTGAGTDLARDGAPGGSGAGSDGGGDSAPGSSRTEKVESWAEVTTGAADTGLPGATSLGDAPAAPAAPGKPGAADASGSGASRTGSGSRNAGPGSGLAAARAAAAGGRGPVSRQAAKPGAPGSSDAPPAEEAPYDPEYDGPPARVPAGGGSASFEGFDPGDEPLDEVIDEKTARESSEQQAMRLLRDAFGAEKIGES